MRYAILILCLFQYGRGFTQANRQALPIIEVQATRSIEKAEGLQIHAIDSNIRKLNLSFNLAQLLCMQSNMFVKQQTPGTLATLSFRGANAMQNAILWNGLPLSSPMNGQIDLNLIPGILFDDIQILSGTSGALSGNAALGGSVFLKNNIDKNGISFFTSIGSFGFQQEGIKSTFQTGQLKVALKAYNTYASNDYPYSDLTLNPPVLKTMQRASFASKGLLGIIQFPINFKNGMEWNVWLQESERPLPAKMGSIDSFSHQSDESERITFNYIHQNQHAQLSFRSALFRDAFDYIDPNKTLYHSSSISWMNNIDLIFHLHQSKVGVTLQEQSDWANYPATINPTYVATFNRSQFRFSGIAYYKWAKNSHPISFGIYNRFQLDSDHFIPFVPQIGVVWNNNKTISFGFTFSRFYRLPTLNEKYWPLMGNPDLRPESGYGVDFNMKYDYSITPVWKINFTSGVYYRLTNDFINWIPINTFLSKPVNHSQVESYGYDVQGGITFNKTRYTIRLINNFSFNSTHVLNDLNNNYSQLIYIPKYRNSFQCFIQMKRDIIFIQHQYTGLVYTTDDNSNAISAYGLWDVNVQHSFALKRIKFTPGIGIFNLMDAAYQTNLNCPMPGRNFKIHLIIQI